MDSELQKACMNGDEQALQEIRDNPVLILGGAVTCCDQTPLHVAVLSGRLSFVKTLLDLKPELASETNSSGCLPLHLASAQGSVEVVCALLDVSPESCDAFDGCERTPLHLAVMKGRLEVVTELIRARPSCALERFGRRETVFHLSVKYCRFECLKLLVRLLRDDHPQMFVDTNAQGNTLLHIASFYKQIKTVKYLVSLEGMKDMANTRNSSGHTALDLVEKSVTDFTSFEILELLTQAGVGRGKDSTTTSEIELESPLPTTPNPTDPPPKTTNITHTVLSQMYSWFDLVVDYVTVKHQLDWIADAQENLMVVATVVASMAFQAGVNPPGGVWQEGAKDKSICTEAHMCRVGTVVNLISSKRE